MDSKDEEELLLEQLVFGGAGELEDNLRNTENWYEYLDEEAAPEGASHDSEASDAEIDGPEDLFFIDEAPDALRGPDSVPTSDMEVDDLPLAWVDSDDERHIVSLTTARAKKLRHLPDETEVRGSRYVERLRAQYEKIYPRPRWAVGEEPATRGSDSENESSDDVDEADDDRTARMSTDAVSKLLKQTASYVQAKTRMLAPGEISVTRLKDATAARKPRGAVLTISFHPLHPILVVGGNDRTARVFHVDGRQNRFVTSVHFRDLQITTCLFAGGADRSWVFVGGPRKFMHRWDVALGAVEKISRMYGQDRFQKNYEHIRVSPRGAFVAVRASSGWCHLLNAHTGQLAQAYRVDGHVADFAFSSDDSVLLVASEEGGIWEFDLTTLVTRILRRWTDSSAVRITQLALGGGDRWLAVGTASGVVNLFDRAGLAISELTAEQPRPFKSVENLVTAVTCLSFSPDGQILCVSLRNKRDAIRLVHLPLGLVFLNFPAKEAMGRVTCTQFSPNGQILAVGNEAGRVALVRMNHW